METPSKISNYSTKIQEQQMSTVKTPHNRSVEPCVGSLSESNVASEQNPYLAISGDPEEVADSLLIAIGATGRRSGIYTARQLRRRIYKEHAHLPMISEVGMPPEVVDYLFYRQIEELIDTAGLTVREEIVFRLYLCGFSRSQTAAAIKRSRWTAARLLGQARAKLQAAYAEGRYAGWYEVYLSEVNRPAYRRKR
jgi:DNA-binding CsgD family transcriptional regulator